MRPCDSALRSARRSGPYAAAIETALAPVELAVDEALSAVTVDDLLHTAAQANLLGASNDGFDFSI